MRRACLAALAWFACQASASAHSWYPIECCSERDCAPVDARDVEEGAEGFLLKRTGEVVDRAAARRSRDEHVHVCRSQASGALLCLFVPDRGS